MQRLFKDTDTDLRTYKYPPCLYDNRMQSYVFAILRYPRYPLHHSYFYSQTYMVLLDMTSYSIL